MWIKSHRWVDVPGTRTEKRWAMNVRESTHTAMVFDKKYVNVETGKLDTDRLCTLNSMSLNDLVETDYYHNDISFVHVRYAKRDMEQPEENVYNFPKHVPKDNDFDEELRRDKQIAQAKELQEKQQKEYAEDRLREHNRMLEQQRIIDERCIQLNKEKEEYEKKLAEVEARLLQESYERNQRIRENNYLRHAGNIRPNVWRPK